MSDEPWMRQHLIYERMVRAILVYPIPIIAAVDGAAYAGGCELALASVFICASDHARDRHQQTFKFLQIAKLDPNASGSAAKPTHLPR